MKKYVYSEAKEVVVCGDIHGAFETLVYKSCVQYSMISMAIEMMAVTTIQNRVLIQVY